MTKKSIQFSVDSQLMGELGEKLVTKNYIALSELIKNSYDADATKVMVRLVDAEEGGEEDNESLIEIIDNGFGMAFKEVREYWMRIATTNKVREPVSKKYGRQRTGNKGIGRFACQRISRQLELETTAKLRPGKYETTTVYFEWEKFKAGTDLTDIPCEYKVSRSNRGVVGFNLKLKNLKEYWTQRDFDMLRRQVLLLSVNKGAVKKGYRKDPGFEIELDASEFERGTGLLYEQVVNAGWGTLTGKVLQGGRVKLKLSARYIGTKEYAFAEKYKDLAGINFEIAWIPQRPEYYRDKKTLPNYMAKELSVWGGIRVYVDNFRIYPYGDPQDDWLKIDQDVARRKASVEGAALVGIAKKLKLDPARVLLDYPRHRSLIGRVFISAGKTSSFSIKMDREGLVENTAYRNLITVLRESIDWMVLYYSVARRRIAKQRVEETEKEFVQSIKLEDVGAGKVVQNALLYLSETAKQQEKGATVKIQPEVIKQAKQVIETKLEETDAELTVLRAMASTGPLLFVFAHEVKGTINSLDTHALYLEDLATSLKGQAKKDAIELADSFRASSKRFTQLSKLFGVFSSAQRLEKGRFLLRKVVESVMESFGFIIGEFGINVDSSNIGDRVKTPKMMEAELYSILVNLVSNAIKALIAGNGDRISVEAVQEKGLVIKVCDSGVGLSKRYWQEVLEPLSVDPENKIYPKLSLQIGDKDLASLGRGSGLGLSIVKGIVEAYGGSINFVEPDKRWKTCIEVRMP